MRRRFCVLVALVACLGLSASATTIDFSEGGLPNGTSLTNQWVAYGITFSVTNGTLVLTDTTTYPPPGGSDFSAKDVAVNSSGGTANVTVTFHALGNAAIPGYVSGSSISLSLWDTEASPSPRVSVNAYDLSNVLLGTIDLTSEWTNGLSGLTGNVAKLVIVDNGGDGHLFDNLTFGAITEVPEPGTFALLGVGLLGVGFALRRRRA